MEAAFFDLDKTVIAKSSMLAFGRQFYRAGMIGRSLIVRGLYAQVVYMLVGADEAQMERARESLLALTKGWDQEHVASVVRETFEETVTPLIFAEAFELFEEHRRAGRKIFIVSSSPEEIVGPIAEHLGVDEAIATRAKLDAEGLYTGELEFYAYGPYKASIMREVAEREGIDLEASYAYSDSITDLPMLEAVGHPHAVNPDKELARAAAEREWPILAFRYPVRLRDRMPVPPAGPTAAVGGALALAGAAVVLAWAVRRGRQRPTGVRRIGWEATRLAENAADGASKAVGAARQRIGLD
jgi:HAD superfamily hydrolase (TIGR01490 family)